MKKNKFIFGGILFLAVAFFLVMLTITLWPQDINVNFEEQYKGIIPKVDSPSIMFNGTELFDSTIFYSENNTCYGSRHGMNIEVFPCVAQSVTGKNIEQFVDFKWNGENPQNVSWYFIYDGVLESGGMDVWANTSYEYVDRVHSLQWVEDYLVDGVTDYTDLGSPTSACELGSSQNNTRMFNVTQINATGEMNTVYCFTDVTTINATAFEVSGWLDVYTPTPRIGYRMEWNDITHLIEYLGQGLLDDNRSYYKVRDEVLFNPGQEIKTRWRYTSENTSQRGKWHIFGHASEKSLVQSVIDEEYIYLDPWWDNSWSRKREINMTSNNGYFIYLDLNWSSGMESDFRDLRFINEAENKELDYTIENYVSSTNVSVRIRSEGEDRIWVYYDNSAAPSVESASETYYSPTLYYYLDEISGTNAEDATGNGFNGTASDSSVFTSEIQGIINTGANFSQDETISVSGLSSGNTFSVSLWVNLNTQSGTFQYIMESRNGDRFLIGRDNSQDLLKFFDGSTFHSSSLAFSDLIGSWNHIVVVVDGTNVKMFHNNTEILDTTIATTSLSSDTNFGSSTTPSNFIDGEIDEVGLWNATALNLTVISNLYNQTMPEYTVGNEDILAGVSTTLISPDDSLLTDNTTIFFQVNSTAFAGSELQNVTLTVWNSTGSIEYQDTQLLSGNSSLTNWTRNFSEGEYSWGAITFGNDGTNDTSSNRTFEIDTSSPILTLNQNISDVFIQGDELPINVSLNYTATDNNLDDCWYTTSDNATEIVFTCNTVTQVTFDSAGVKTIFYSANDTTGSFTTDQTSFEIGTYTQEVNKENITEGETSQFTLILNKSGVGLLDTEGSLIYNGDEFEAGSIAIPNDNSTILSKSIVIPFGTGNSTGNIVPWNWTFTTDTLGNFNTTTQNQTVFSVNIDNCSVFSEVLLNYTLYDEDTVTLINGTTQNASIEVEVTITSNANSSQQTTLGQTFTNTNNALICVNELSGDLRVDAQARYTADDYVVEFHNIQNATLDTSDFPQNVSLYSLLAENSQEFVVTFKDSSFVPVDDALISVTRKYVGEGLFRTVEAPLTSEDGQALVHLVLGDVIYTMVVTKDGELLGTFDNIVPFCESLSTGDCRISLNAFSTGTAPTSFETKDGVSYSISFDKPNREVTVQFSNLDGSISTFRLNGTVYDARGNTSACSTSVATSSGSLVCSVPIAVGNSSIKLNFLKDGDLVTTSFFDLRNLADTTFGYTGVMMGLFMYMTIGLMMVSSPVAIIIGAVLGMVFAGLFLLFDGGSLIGITSTIIWFIIAGGVLIWQFNRGRR